MNPLKPRKLAKHCPANFGWMWWMWWMKKFKHGKRNAWLIWRFVYTGWMWVHFRYEIRAISFKSQKSASNHEFERLPPAAVGWPSYVLRQIKDRILTEAHMIGNNDKSLCKKELTILTKAFL